MRTLGAKVEGVSVEERLTGGKLFENATYRVEVPWQSDLEIDTSIHSLRYNARDYAILTAPDPTGEERVIAMVVSEKA